MSDLNQQELDKAIVHCDDLWERSKREENIVGSEIRKLCSDFSVLVGIANRLNDRVQELEEALKECYQFISNSDENHSSNHYVWDLLMKCEGLLEAKSND